MSNKSTRTTTASRKLAAKAAIDGMFAVAVTEGTNVNAVRALIATVQATRPAKTTKKGTGPISVLQREYCAARIAVSLLKKGDNRQASDLRADAYAVLDMKGHDPKAPATDRRTKFQHDIWQAAKTAFSKHCSAVWGPVNGAKKAGKAPAPKGTSDATKKMQKETAGSDEATPIAKSGVDAATWLKDHASRIRTFHNRNTGVDGVMPNKLEALALVESAYKALDAAIKLVSAK